MDERAGRKTAKILRGKTDILDIQLEGRLRSLFAGMQPWSQGTGYSEKPEKAESSFPEVF